MTNDPNDPVLAVLEAAGAPGGAWDIRAETPAFGYSTLVAEGCAYRFPAASYHAEAAQRAVNTFAGAREALRAVVTMAAHGADPTYYRDHIGAMAKVRAALAAMEGE